MLLNQSAEAELEQSLHEAFGKCLLWRGKYVFAANPQTESALLHILSTLAVLVVWKFASVTSPR
jgi:hypothetical protein